MSLILAIETSCDETAAAVIEDGHRIRSNVVASQIELHRPFGGVYPELASRQHVLDIVPVIERAMHDAAVTWGDLSALAVTRGPGLAGSLLVGVNTAKAIAWIRTNFAKPLRVEDLADVAGMGVSTLHHHFRALTAMSPLQYQKQIRLQAARGRMLVDGLDAASAAFEVGYESASQFNREYSRFFGQPPMRDVRALRSPSAPLLELVGNRQDVA